MNQTKYSIRVYIDKAHPYVMIRVRWLSSTRQTCFSTGIKADVLEPCRDIIEVMD